MRNIPISVVIVSVLSAMGAASGALAEAVYTPDSLPNVEINLDAISQVVSNDTPVSVAPSNPSMPSAPPVTTVTPEVPPAPVPQAPAAETTPAEANMASAPATAATAPENPSIFTAPGATAPFNRSGYVELGGNYSKVTNDFGNWNGEYLKGEVQTDEKNRWNGEFLDQREFKSNGQYLMVGNTHSFNSDWYSIIDVGGADEGFFLPRYRIDAFLNRKWLSDKSLVTTLGLGDYKSMDDHSNQSLFLGATYYFPQYWIAQGGITFNDSRPGNVKSTYEFLALTEGEDKKHFVTLRYAFGREAYQITGPSPLQTLSDFHSDIVSLDWRQWVRGTWGFDMLGEYYHNPSYSRTGITLGVFDEF